jgi:DNA-binding transcriptional regulator GbsR (MarR family)
MSKVNLNTNKGKIINYFHKNKKVEMNVTEISKKLGISDKSVSAIMSQMKPENHIKRKQYDGVWYYSYSAKKSKFVMGDNGKRPATKKTKPKNENVPVPKNENVPVDDLLDFTDLNISDSLAKIIRTEQQNQMYKQAFGQILSILEQIGLVKA